MGSAKVDASAWPIAVFTVEGNVTDEQIDELMRQGTELLMRAEKYATVMDASRIGQVSAYTRSRSTEWQRRYRAELKQHCVGTAYVIPSPLVRFIAMTVLMVTQLPMPYTVVATEAEARAWAEKKLADMRAGHTA